MSTLRAIETVWRGYRFRSRLEARWAVFFDALGVSWEYEPEGFETSAGWYLPDFRLTGQSVPDLYVEVRPKNEFEPKVSALNGGFAGTGLHCQFVYGDPFSWFEHRWLQLARICTQVCEEYSGDACGVPKLADVPVGARLFTGSYIEGRFPWGVHDWRAAATAARQARFEHGETPR